MRLSGPSSGRLSTGDRSSVSQRLPYPSFVAALFLKPGGPLKGRTLLSRQKGDPAICHSVAGPAVVTLMRRLRQRRSCLGVGFKKAELIKEARLDAAEVGVRWRDGGKCSGGQPWLRSRVSSSKTSIGINSYTDFISHSLSTGRPGQAEASPPPLGPQTGREARR